MNPELLYQAGSRLVKRCGTRNPFAIADDLGIKVMFCSNFGPLKGMYRVIKRNRFVFINSDLSKRMKQIVCAHEIGHDQLHRQLAQGGAIQEFMLYDMTLRPEYEANVVAADILMDTNELLEYIYQSRYSAEQISKTMSIDQNLVALKIECLRNTGHDLRPLGHQSNFLA